MHLLHRAAPAITNLPTHSHFNYYTLQSAHILLTKKSLKLYENFAIKIYLFLNLDLQLFFFLQNKQRIIPGKTKQTISLFFFAQFT